MYQFIKALVHTSGPLYSSNLSLVYPLSRRSIIHIQSFQEEDRHSPSSIQVGSRKAMRADQSEAEKAIPGSHLLRAYTAI